MAGRVWTAVLLLAAVLAVHGAQCAADAGGGHVSAHTTATSSLLTGLGAAHAHATPEFPTAAPGSHQATTASGPAAGLPGAPQDSPAHLWTVCLAVLAAALAGLLAAGLPRRARPTRLAPAWPRARLRALMPPRPPDLSILCLLRI